MKDFPKYQNESRLLHGADYNPDQWLKYPHILADDLVLMKQSRTNTFSVGIFAWSALEPSEGKFEFDWLDKIFDGIAGIDGNIILSTPSGARPAWLSWKYPEVLRVNSKREKHLHGGRHNHCFSSPVYREKTGTINRKLAERYGKHPAMFMWHISNEYGGDCHCHFCQQNFRDWLRKKYGTIEALNDAYWASFWSHTYNDFSQIESPSPIGENSVHALNLDWKRFVTDMTIDFYRNEIIPIREITPEIPVTNNFMANLKDPQPFNGLDYSKFAKEVDIVSWDAYPAWHNNYETTEMLASKLAFANDYFRSLKNKPFLIMECTPSMVNWHSVNKPKRPGMHLLSSVACLAHGADSVMYFQWRKSRGSSEKLHGAVVDHDNSPNNRVFKEVQALGEVLENIKEIKGSRTSAGVAILYDVENSWALNDAQGFNMHGKEYSQTVHAHYKAFWDANVQVDVITKDKDITPYEVVVAPMLYMMTEKQMNEFKAYVAGGGILVFTYITGMVGDTDLVHLGGFPATLREVLGINVLETDTLYPENANTIVLDSGKQYEAFDYCAVMETCGAQIRGTYGHDFYAGTPAVTCNGFGKGRAYFVGARTGADFLKDFYDGILMDLKLPDIPVQVPHGVSVRIRENDGFRYCFVMNFSEDEKEISLTKEMADLVSGCRIPQGKHKMKRYGVFILKGEK